jgi:NADP-dependent 3-hydroxy acid dehydrogenase YdfG
MDCTGSPWCCRGWKRKGTAISSTYPQLGGSFVQPTAAVYAATKFAVREISEGLRKESDKIRCTCVYPGVVESELADTISDPTARERMKAYRKMAIQPDAIGRAIQRAREL